MCMKHSRAPGESCDLVKSDILLHCNWCKYRVAAVERLTILRHCADYIFISFGITGISENGVLLMYTLDDVSIAANFITAYEESQ